MIKIKIKIKIKISETVSHKCVSSIINEGLGELQKPFSNIG